MDKIDRAAAKQITAAIVDVLGGVATELGLEVEVGGGRFDSHVGTFAPKVEFRLADARRREFERFASFFGLEADDYGREFASRGRTYRVTGLATRARRFPVLAEDVETGRTYKFEPRAVQRAAGREATAV